MKKLLNMEFLIIIPKKLMQPDPNTQKLPRYIEHYISDHNVNRNKLNNN